MSIGYKTLLLCFLRTYCMGANFNNKGLQNIGLAFALDPGLKALYAEERQLMEARERYLAPYNSHPWWNPMLVGYFLFLESHISKGTLSAQSMEGIRNAATHTLSALGDSFFGGSIQVLWSLACVLLLLGGLYWAAVVWLLLPLLCLQAFKLTTFWLGWSKGLNLLQKIREMDLMGCAERVKMLNALLIAALWFTFFLLGPYPWLMLPAALPLAGAVYLVARYGIPRELPLLALAIVLLTWQIVF